MGDDLGVVLSAMGEGFQQGNDKVLLELGKNIGIVWGGRTSLQAGGERAGRAIVSHARRCAGARRRIVDGCRRQPRAAASGVRVKSAYNAASVGVSGIEPQYQDIRTIELEYGRNFTWKDEEQVARVAIVGFDMAEQLFGKRHILGEVAHVQRDRLHGRRQDSQEGTGQQLQRAGQQQDLRAVCGDGEGHAAAGRRAGRGVRHHRVAEGLGGR